MTKATVIRLAGDHEIAGALADSLMARQLQAVQAENNILRQRVSELEREVLRSHGARQDNEVLRSRVRELDDERSLLRWARERDNARRLAEAKERYGIKPNPLAVQLISLGLALGLIEEDAAM